MQTVSETSSTPIQFSPTAKAALPAGTPVEPGSVQVEEDVTVTFAIRVLWRTREPAPRADPCELLDVDVEELARQ